MLKNIYSANYAVTVLFVPCRPGYHMLSLICQALKKARRSAEDNYNRNGCTIKMFHISINKILQDFLQKN